MKPVKIYIKRTCPYCQMALRLLKSKAIDPEIISVDSDSETYQKLKQKTGHQTVPQIFIGEEFIGGFDDLSSLEQQGQLESKLA